MTYITRDVTETLRNSTKRTRQICTDGAEALQSGSQKYTPEAIFQFYATDTLHDYEKKTN